MSLLELGKRYVSGEGLPKDQIEAYAHLNLAGIGEEESRKELLEHEKTMTHESILRGQQRTKELQKEIEAKVAAKQAAK